MKRLTIEQMENLSGGDITTLSGCFKAMYDFNEAMKTLSSSTDAFDIAMATYNLSQAWSDAQDKCGQL